MAEDTEGKWLGVAKAPGDRAAVGDDEGVFAVHAGLLRTGRVILWAGGLEREEGVLYRSWTWDPATFVDPDTALTGVEGRWFLPDFDPGGPNAGDTPDWDDNPDLDLFCAHHVTLEDGRVLAVGGTARPPFSKGSKSVFTYDPDAERWQPHSPGLNKARWYPTAVVLRDGRVAIFSGRPSGGLEPTAEILDGENLTAAIISGANRSMYIYPGLLMVPGGDVFYVPTAWQYEGANDTSDVKAGVGPTASIRVTGMSGSWTIHKDPVVPTEDLYPQNFLREEGTFVLLPPAREGRILLIGGGFATDPNHSTAAAQQSTGMDTCEILHTQGGLPRWTPAGKMRRPRSNVHAVLLPDGKLLILGGHDGAKRVHATDQLIPEMFDPTVPYDPGDPHAAFTDMAPMGASRLYHATALLLPDGRVLVAGGEDQDHVHPHKHGSNHHSIELYEPPYLHQAGAQPTIAALDGGDRPSHELGYGDTVSIATPDAATIASVVLMRLGSTTHHTDTEQRHVAMDFASLEGEILAVPPSDPSVAPPGYYMLFIVDDDGLPCEEAEIVRLSHRRCTLVTDRSTFSIDELGAGTTTFSRSFYVSIDGFLPSELDITTATPTPAQLDDWAPSVVVRDGGSTAEGIVAVPKALHPQDPSLPAGVRQRLTFEYEVQISSTAAFPAPGDDLNVLEVVATLAVQVHGATEEWRCRGTLRLTRQANPFMLDGPTHWLSMDVRVLKVRNTEDPFGIATPVTDPTGYIQDLLTVWNGLPEGGHPFASLTEDQQESALQLAAVEAGEPVYNFAVARVRYRGQSLPASAVRVFFRMFSTATTNMAFDSETTYRRHSDGARVVPLLGIRGGDVASIPFFAVPRIDTTISSMEAQPEDSPNVRSIPATGGGESTTYFGAWLDINQGVGRFPLSPGSSTGPYPAASVSSIKNLINGKHQCLVAEIHFADDPIPPDVTPANNDNLSQRNLAIEGSDNPGGPEAHTLALTFEIDPTWNVVEAVRQRDAVPLHVLRKAAGRAEEEEGRVEAFAAADLPDERRDALEAERTRRVWRTPPMAFRPPPHAHAPEPVFDWIRPDELMIDWGGLPEAATAELYVPGIRSSDVVELLERRWAEQGYTAVDDDTLSIPVGGMSHIPVPALKPGPLAALLTVRLPETVRKRQVFTVTVHQVSTAVRRVVGSFELRIPVAGGEDFLEAENRWLAVLKDTLEHRPGDHRWTPVLRRLLGIVAGRVRGFGGHPDAVPPSPRGYDPERPPSCPDPGAHDPSRGKHPHRSGPRRRDDGGERRRCLCPFCLLLGPCIDDERRKSVLEALFCTCEGR